MACQSNPNTYAIVFRCPLENGAKLKTMAETAGMTVSAYVAKMVDDHVDDRALSESEKSWVNAHYEANKIRRTKADAMTANGYFKKKRRGRPRKPGPRKGSKRIIAI